MLRFILEIRVIHIVRIWALLYIVLENDKKIYDDSLLSLSLQIQWFIQDAVQLPGACFNSRELNFHV